MIFLIFFTVALRIPLASMPGWLKKFLSSAERNALTTLSGMDSKGIKSLLYNDGYTIRGVQKVIKENGTKQLLKLELDNKTFTEIKKDNIDPSSQNNMPKHVMNETKRRKLMDVLNDLVQLRQKLEDK